MNRWYKTVLGMVTAALVLAGCGGNTAEPEKPAAPASPAASSSAAADTKDSAQKWYQKGQAAYQEFRLDEAIDCCSKAIEEDPNLALAYSTRAAARALAGQAEEGLKDSEKAIALAPDSAQVYYDQALVLKVLKRYEEAIAAFKKVLAKDDKNTWSYYGIATIYGDMGDAPNAVAYLERAVACGGDAVKEAAREQTHFDSIREDFKFQELIK